MKIQVFLFLFLLVYIFSFGQSINGEISYLIEIKKLKKGWIDSENSYWLLEKSEEKKSNCSFLESYFFATNLPENYIDKLTKIDCCQNDIFLRNKISELNIKSSDIRNLFENNKKNDYLIKFEDYTINILVLKQSNCKCSIKTFYPNIDKENTVAVLLSYEVLKIDRNVKKWIKKNSNKLINTFFTTNF